MKPYGIATVVGAANSGKSAFAEGLAGFAGAGRVYLATGRALDDEMAAKILAHRRARGEGWETREEPLFPERVLEAARPGQVVLLDCATMWLSNLMLEGHDLSAAEARLLAALATAPVPVVVVTNEVGAGVVPETALGRAFRSAQGRLNQRLAAVSDLVVLVSVGLPLVLKGALPVAAAGPRGKAE